MNVFRYKLSALLLLAGLGFASTASATLLTRPGGMVYDTGRNITWLQDANYARTSGYDADGLMDWTAATTWAANLVYGGYSDWRLPTADPVCGSNYNCTGSELGHLFYQELGVTAANSILTGNATELAKFSNIKFYYWSGTEYAPNPPFAWYFRTDLGYQSNIDKRYELWGWAVRSGDVAAAAPEPGSLTLLGAGLAGWFGGRQFCRLRNFRLPKAM